MLDIDILQPESIEEALEMLANREGEAKVIAGGTAVVLMLKSGLIAPSTLISLGRIQGMDTITHEPGVGLQIGALATLRDGEISDLVGRANPTLAKTFGTVANIRIRNAATVGGNLSEADYASDPPSTFLAMRATVTARSARGERQIPMTSFFRDFYETALEPDELITEVQVPDITPSMRSSYLKYVSRSSEDRPCVGVAAVVDLTSDGRCKELRVAVGAVAATPQEVESAEALARGQELNADLIEEIAQTYASSIDPLDDLRGSKWYRQQMIRVFVRRSIESALSNGSGVPA
jgi:carbon-monoxide dehydrogenase medium subunit